MTERSISHDMSMVWGERHVLSVDCPCEPDLELIGKAASVLYHFPLTDRVSRSQPSTTGSVGSVESQDRETES